MSIETLMKCNALIAQLDEAQIRHDIAEEFAIANGLLPQFGPELLRQQEHINRLRNGVKVLQEEIASNN